MFTGLIFTWDGWTCKVHELVAGAYRVTCLDWDGIQWVLPHNLLAILGRGPGS